MNRPSQVILLAEDTRHQRFVRGYLKRLGYSTREVRDLPLPGGRGCGEQWVRERYAQAVRAYRWRSAKSSTALVVVIDADKGDVTHRLGQFSEALRVDSLEPRAGNEAIVHFIPRRNIETWILCLNGRSVDEETDYCREHEVDDLIPPAAQTFFAWSRENANVPPHCVPSLHSALPEARRIPPRSP